MMYIVTLPTQCIYLIGLFVLFFSSHSRIFRFLRDVTMTGEGLQILTYMLGTYGHLAARVL